MSLAPTTPDRKNTTAKHQHQHTANRWTPQTIRTTIESGKLGRRGLLETVKIFEPIHAFSQIGKFIFCEPETLKMRK